MKSESPPLTLRLRRGSKVIPRFPVKLLVPYIREGKLLPGDEISPNGKQWLRLEKYPQLARYFRGGVAPVSRTDVLPVPKEGSASDDARLPVAPPNLGDTLENLAGMLKDLNR